MGKNTIDVYIAGRHFKINHESREYVMRAAAIVEEKFSQAQAENSEGEVLDNMILTSLDLCDDMLTERANAAAAGSAVESLNKKIDKMTAEINSLKREIEYFKSPKFIIPTPISKGESSISPEQLCFFPFKARSSLKPAVNGLKVANIRRNSSPAANGLKDSKSN